MKSNLSDNLLDKLKATSEGKKLANTVNEIHTLLSHMGNSGDEDIAQRASNFLTWLLFNNSMKNEPYLNKEIRNQLLKDPIILNIVNSFNEISLISQNIKQNQANYNQTLLGDFYNQRGITTEKMFVKLINNFIVNGEKIQHSGSNQATVWLSSLAKYLVQNGANELDQSLKDLVNKQNLIKENRKLRFAYRDVKMDTMSNSPSTIIQFGVEDVNLQKDLRAVYSVFSSATIKSQDNLKNIDLEEVNILKAYSAFINYARGKISQSEIKNLFVRYYKDNNDDFVHNPYITLHINHIISVYALTGMGTTLQSDLNSILKGARYIVVVDNIKQKVIIHSAHKIINNILLTKKYSKNIVTNIQLNLTNKSLTK